MKKLILTLMTVAVMSITFSMFSQEIDVVGASQSGLSFYNTTNNTYTITLSEGNNDKLWQCIAPSN